MTEIETSVIYIQKDELLALLNKAYEGGCYSYIDLKDSVIAAILDEFLAEQEKEPRIQPGFHLESYTPSYVPPPIPSTVIVGSGDVSGTSGYGYSGLLNPSGQYTHHVVTTTTSGAVAHTIIS